MLSPVRDNLGQGYIESLGFTCRFSHPWGQPGLGGQYLALQHVPKDQTSTRTSGGFSGLHIKSQTQLRASDSIVGEMEAEGFPGFLNSQSC